MKYNPEKHYRQSIRLKGYDYSHEGSYFITICTHNRELYFDIYPDLKEIVENEWKNIPNFYSYVSVDECVIMPNHIHGIITVGAILAVARNERTVDQNDGDKRAGTQNNRNINAGALKKRAGDQYIKG